MIETGRVLAVSTKPVGSLLTADHLTGATAITVESVAEFDDDGGWLSLNGTAYQYTGYDDATGTITLVEPLAADALTDDSVYLYDATTNLIVTVTTAIIAIGGDEENALEGEVEHALIPFLPDGIREVEGETVEIRWDSPTSFRVVNVIGKPPEIDANRVDLHIVNEEGEVAAWISPEGDGTFRDLTVSGTIYLTPGNVDYGGETLAARLDRLPQGRLAYAMRDFGTSGSISASATYTTLYSLDCEIEGTADRSITFHRYGKFRPGAAGISYDVKVHYTYNATEAPAAPTTTDTVLMDFMHPTEGATIRDEATGDSYTTNLAPGFYRFLLVFRRWSTTNTTITPIGIHTFAVEDAGVAQANGGSWSDSGGTQAPVATEYVKTWDATDSHWYNGSGDLKGTGDANYFGNSSSTGDGNRKTAIWFSKSNIVSTLAGATVTKVELYLYLFDGGNDNTVAIGSHTDTSPGGNYGSLSGANRQRQTSGNWNEGTGRWVTINFDNQEWATSGQIAGFVIGPSSNSTDAYAGGIRGSGHSLHPKLRITYTK